MIQSTRTTKATGADLYAFIRHCFGMGDRLYGVVDASRDKQLAYAAPRRYGQTIRWLFQEGSGRHMLNVAPYLVPIAFRPKYPYQGSGYLDMWARRLGSSGGILMVTGADFDTLWRHLRSLFAVEDDDPAKPKKFYLRFYDPRVIRPFLATCNREELKEFFGPIRRILCEDETAGDMLIHGLQGPDLQIVRKSITDAARPAERRGTPDDHS